MVRRGRNSGRTAATDLRDDGRQSLTAQRNPLAVCSGRVAALVGALAACLFALVACGSTAETPPLSVRGGGTIGVPTGVPGFSGGVVATSEPQPAEAAANVLAAGGNAVDAAAVAQFMLNVVEPQSSGIGGGGFMLVWLAASRTLIALDCRETAPTAARPEMFLGSSGTPLPWNEVSTSGLSVGVPGTLHCIDTALRRWGTLSLATALAPAIEAAEQGIIVGHRLAESLAEGLTSGGRLANETGNEAYATARAVFAPDGRPLQQGERLRQPDLAATFRALASDGLPAFYDCAHPSGIARALIATQRAQRPSIAPAGAGRMTCDDLSAYRSVLRQPVEGRYRGIVVRSMPAPSSGGIALIQMLTMLQRLPMGDGGAGFGFGSFATLNVMQDAMRLAFADRAKWVGDADAVPGLPLRGLINETYLAQRAATCPMGDPGADRWCLRPGVRLADIRPGDPRPFDGPLAAELFTPHRRSSVPAAVPEGTHTTHFTIADQWGNVVSYTSTIEAAWGTGLMVPGYGFMLNNELTDFNPVPARKGKPGDADFNPGANDVAPGKRPRSSMAPTMLFVRGPDGDRPIAAYGSPGGSTIINSVLAITLNLIDHRMSIQEAVDRPRLSLCNPREDATTLLEEGFDPAVIDRLGALGYRFRPAVIGSVQAVVLDPATGFAWGAADKRRDGTVIGLMR